jgi:hypothetical protein
MALTYTITDLPPVWPGKRTTYHKKAPFKSLWSRTEKALERELKHLGARKIEIAIDLPRGALDLRRDGMLKADARPKPPVILSFLDSEGARHAYPCDTYGWWEDNLHAIAVVLEDLRRAERYGVQSALLRAGFKALPAQATPTMDVETAARVVVAGFSSSCRSTSGTTPKGEGSAPLRGLPHASGSQQRRSARLRSRRSARRRRSARTTE